MQQSYSCSTLQRYHTACIMLECLLEWGLHKAFFTEIFPFPALKTWLLEKEHDMKQNKKQCFFDWMPTCENGTLSFTPTNEPMK